jgi:hypothetical protein
MVDQNTLPEHCFAGLQSMFEKFLSLSLFSIIPATTSIFLHLARGDGIAVVHATRCTQHKMINWKLPRDIILARRYYFEFEEQCSYTGHEKKGSASFQMLLYDLVKCTVSPAERCDLVSARFEKLKSAKFTLNLQFR